MVQFSMSDGIAELTLDRPERRNAICSADIARIIQLLPKLESARAVVLSGLPPSFCAGSDLKELGALDIAGMVGHENATAAMVRHLALITTPVVAAVEGHALGGGFILAASCDLVVTAETAKWGLPEVPNGWLPPWGLKVLCNRTGPVTAQRLTWGFETLDGREAMRLGVADYCVPEGAALDRARAVAAQLAALPETAVRSTKAFFQTTLMDKAEIWDAEASRRFARDCESSEARQTLARFAR